MQYRCWRYRFKSEVPSIHFVRSARLAGRTLLDIGANRGIYSIYMSRAAGPAGRVIAFEPQPELEAHLEAVRQGFRLHNLEIENVGLSSAPGELVMRRPKTGSGAASFHVGPEQNWEAFSVPVFSLDEYIERTGIGPVHLVKADVEGHELDVFRGGERLLRRSLPALILECNHELAGAGELFDLLESFGYAGYFFHVSPRDHRSWLHKNRGRYVPAAQYADFEYCRPEVRARNYLVLRRGLDPVEVHRGACDPS